MRSQVPGGMSSAAEATSVHPRRPNAKKMPSVSPVKSTSPTATPRVRRQANGRKMSTGMASSESRKARVHAASSAGSRSWRAEAPAALTQRSVLSA